MGYRADPANPLGEMLGIPGVPVHQDLFESSEKRSRGPGVHHLLNPFHSIHGYFYFEVTLQPGYGVNDLYCGHLINLLKDFNHRRGDS